MYNFVDDYNQTKNIFESNLKKFIDTFNYYPRLGEAMKYSLNAGGKRLRPVLMLRCAELVGLPEANIMPLAISIELIHTYSLIHDDLPCMDDDDLRRGKPTNHIVFGEDMAVLAGDGLLNLAMETALSGLNSDNCKNYINGVKMLFSSSGSDGMIGGQAIDILNTGKFQSIEELKVMHSKKTGALFTASCLCPALISGANDDIINCLREYSKYLGLLFQIKDDILDVTGNEKELGKTIGKDEANHKSTFVSHMGLAQSIKYLKEIALDAKKPIECFGEKGDFLRDLIEYILERNN